MNEPPQQTQPVKFIGYNVAVPIGLIAVVAAGIFYVSNIQSDVKANTADIEHSREITDLRLENIESSTSSMDRKINRLTEYFLGSPNPQPSLGPNLEQKFPYKPFETTKNDASR